MVECKKHFSEGKIHPDLKIPRIERKQNVKKLVEFTINIKVKIGVGSFETPVLLDSGVQDCFIDDEFARAKGLCLQELPPYLQRRTWNANNTLSTKKLRYEVHCMVEFQGH